MHFAFSSFFWGFFFILLGISLIVKIIFKIKIPVIRLFFATLILSIGIKLVVKAIFSNVLPNTVILETKNFDSEVFSPNYLIIFGESELNLKKYAFTQNKLKKIKIINFAGKFHLIYDTNYPIKIRVNNIFSFSRLMTQDLTLLDKADEKSSSYDPLMEHLDIEITAIFGDVSLNR